MLPIPLLIYSFLFPPLFFSLSLSLPFFHIMPEVRVQPRSVYEHHIFVQRANATINWNFSTKKKSICFGLYFRSGTSTRVSIDEQPKMKKRNLSLPKLRNKTTAVDDQPYYSDTDDGNNKRNSAVHSVKESSSSSVHSRNRRKSSSAVSVTNLLDNDFVELIPIDQVNSSKEVISGSFLAEEPGNYVLIFGTQIYIKEVNTV